MDFVMIHRGTSASVSIIQNGSLRTRCCEKLQSLSSKSNCRLQLLRTVFTHNFEGLICKTITTHRQGGFCHEAGFVLGQGTKPTLVIGP